MRLSRRIMSSNGLRSVVCWLGSLYIRLVHMTVKWQVVRGDIPAQFWDTEKPFIVCLWHGRFLLMPYAFRAGKPVHMLISSHSDGQLISKVLRHFNIGTVEGSTNRGGATALKSMVKILKSGQSIGITPDGPRGPRMRVSGGVVALAKLSGVPVIPATCSTTRRKVLGSWDRFLICLPFGSGVYVWGEPIEIPRDANADQQENYRLQIEDAMNALCDEADTLANQPPIEPAPLEATS
ncbi:MAG: lysophospholipid acyltransferase family protein [Rhodospirillales bacterium]|nr:lysophospholipid acyltransferase family protein [Rhodospirillales bacterium]MBT7356996.1 lysophospholipid acyltransferase family protein [Rhodospirillaceae bacterium]